MSNKANISITVDPQVQALMKLVKAEIEKHNADASALSLIHISTLNWNTMYSYATKMMNPNKNIQITLRAAMQKMCIRDRSGSDRRRDPK